MDQQDSEKLRKKKRCCNNAQRSRKQQDWHNVKKIKKEIQKICRETYNSFISNMLSDNNISNPKRFCGFIKSKRMETSGVAPLRKKGILYSDTTT